ncbi:lysozyme inhibitor LprI family protein [Pantoea stewartii]|uniref:lysozyme inhibitor LprI family protein n=1 Tax=Pantoea stewartii TaxID=66269 RepID=UPI001F03D518|nr:lysozyme inhibitor LprI family protein [Pantoea stewartii]
MRKHKQAEIFMCRQYIYSLAFIFFIFGHSAYAMDDCSKETSDPAVFTCAEKNKNTAEQKLNNEYSAAKKRIDKVFQNEAEVKKGYLNIFLESQRSWLKYRDGQCKLFAHVADKNSNPYMVFTNNCIAELDEARTKQLEQIPYD